MAAKALPAPEVLRQLLDYDPDTGTMTWRERPASAAFNALRAGTPALQCIGSSGYREGSLLGRNVKAQRVIFALIYGRWPQGHIDHINGDRLDNRASNLREVSQPQNNLNKGLYKNNKCGTKGIYRRGGSWRAQIQKDGVKIMLGSFATAENAAQAYREAAFALHGDYARR